jgi:GNAT superfamily N-acetyltransferase
VAKARIIALYDQDQRIAVRYPDTRREAAPGVVRHVSTAKAGEGLVIYSRLDGANVDTAIDEQVAYFQRLGQDFEWKLYDHDTPGDLMVRLAAKGFEIEPAEAIMVLDMGELPDRLVQPVRHAVKKIRDAAGVRDVVAVEKEVWAEEQGWLGEYLGGVLSTEPERISVFVAYVEGKPVSAGWIYYPPESQFASLWGGSTLEEFRNRGLYTALLAARAQEAQRRRVRYLTVDASPMSQPILEGFGFVKIADSYPCKWKITR